ncbi:ABC transporter permease [Pollutimonas thiosulfatoxidans]|uniref:Peptide ABC transporter permease n=1 Tax=Pollutimonas thiosulfatoxidans TaxID=2028345 RepID=A0A410GC18_9BURK|nr:ABC transporter permease [Pollutimonas thiosulfatoxidans]QAA93824.1 peptide ABC transporter permease [Pollutimonas thiosulfatoxidans]
MPSFVFLWTDVFVYFLVLAMLFYVWRARRSAALRSAWRSVARTPSAMCAAVVLLTFITLGVLDSIHYRPLLPPIAGASATDPAPAPVYSPVLRSALDDLLSLTQLAQREKTYSAPLAIRQFTKETELIDGQPVRDFPRLKYAGLGIDTEAEHVADISRRVLTGLAVGAALSLLAALLLTLAHRVASPSWSAAWRAWWRGENDLPWRAVWITASLLLVLGSVALVLGGNYHVLGTDRTGNDVLWQCLKSIRTALVIGTLTTLAMLPPALMFGIAAGYFKGRVDDVIQYIYTTLTSIPGVLLIAACVLMMQVYIDNNPELFDTVAARADLRLFMLCMILGLTGWAGLCRLLRAETLKLRELEYVQAARAFGVGHWRIMRRHLLPNLMHIVLITLVLEFSSLVLYEAVLSYLGIGVDPSTPSFGTMIDAARLEMSRDPMIWWNLLGAFLFLLALVLSANIFADAVQDAFDPRTRRFRSARLARAAPVLTVPAADAGANASGAER